MCRLGWFLFSRSCYFANCLQSVNILMTDTTERSRKITNLFGGVKKKEKKVVYTKTKDNYNFDEARMILYLIFFFFASCLTSPYTKLGHLYQSIEKKKKKWCYLMCWATSSGKIVCFLLRCPEIQAHQWISLYCSRGNNCVMNTTFWRRLQAFMRLSFFFLML